MSKKGDRNGVPRLNSRVLICTRFQSLITTSAAALPYILAGEVNSVTIPSYCNFNPSQKSLGFNPWDEYIVISAVENSTLANPIWQGVLRSPILYDGLG